MSRLFNAALVQRLEYAGDVVGSLPFTVSAYVKVANIANHVAMSFRDDDLSGTSNNNFLMYLSNITPYTLRAQLHDGTTGKLLITSTGYGLDVWQHICCVFDTNYQAVYLNGGGKDTDTLGVGYPVSPIDIFRIGSGGQGGTTFPFTGLITQVAIWSKKFTDADVLLLQGVSPETVYPGDLIAFWPLTANDLDYVGAFDLTPINNPLFSDDEPFPVPQPSEGFIDDIQAPEGIQLQLRSPSGEILAYLSDSDESGKILDVEIVERKIGGVESFKFKISNDTDLPITRNTECYFYVNGILRFIGQIIEIPLPDQSNPILEIIGEGFYKNLKKKVINESYSSESLFDIIIDIASTYLGSDIDIFYDANKIDVPNITGITIEFKDKSLFDVFSTLLQIANYDYENLKYRFYIDIEKDFVFEPLSNDYQYAIFEGYQFQAPEVSEDNSNIVNRILTFRTTQANPKTAEYVAAYEDTASQGRYGLFEKKITYPDYIDTTTIAKLAAMILQRRANPQTKIALKTIEIFRPRSINSGLGILDNGSGQDDWMLDKDISTNEQIILRSDFRRGLEEINFGEYAIFNKRNKIWEILAECDSLTGWDTTNLSVTTLALSTDKVLTGRQSMKFTVGSGSSGEYAELTLEKEIPLPQAVRAYMYFANDSDHIRITFYDTNDDYKELDFGTIVDTFTDQWIKRSADVAITEIINVKRIRVTMLSNDSFSFYLDRLDCYADLCKFRSLQLEEVTYHLSSKQFTADLNFGELEDNIIDEIDKKVEDGDIALAIFSKQ